MTTTDTMFPQGPYAKARTEPEILNGWTRSVPWVNRDASDGGQGEMAVGPGLVTTYEKVLPDGTVLSMEFTTSFWLNPQVYYGEGEIPKDAEIFAVESVLWATAASEEEFHQGRIIDSGQDFEDAMTFIHYLVDGEVRDEDVAWLFTYHGDTDHRHWLNDWKVGEPVY